MVAARIADDKLTPQDGIEETFALVDETPIRPPENKSISQFEIKETLPKVTFHQVHKVIRKDSPDKTYFLKENPRGSIFSLIEPVAAQFYKLLNFSSIPATYAVTDEKDTLIGVASEEINGFKSTAVDPLTEEDLNIDFIESKRIGLNVLNKLDKDLEELEEKAYVIDKRLKDIETNEKQLNTELKQLPHDKLRESKATLLCAKLETISESKVAIYKAKSETTRDIFAFNKALLTTHNITEKELDNYRIAKEIAKTLTSSYIFMEDDLHQNNFSKYGKRIDFDMSLWPISYHFKEDPFSVLRKPTEHTFKITKTDIIEFPNITHATPFYWPTKSSAIVSDSLSALIKKFIPLSTNIYPYTANIIFSKLSKNPVFVFYKFWTLAKYILTNGNIYRNLALLHMREDTLFQNKLLIDQLALQQSERIAELTNVLIGIPEFVTFFKKNQEKLMEELCKDAAKLNIIFDKAQIESSRIQILKRIESHKERKEAKSTPVPSLSESKEVKAESVSNMHDKLEELKAAVINAMKIYQNPGFFSSRSFSMGLFRNHDKEAKEIITFCENLKAHPTDRETNINSILKLKNKILAPLNTIKSGTMFDYLSGLLVKIEAVLPQTRAIELRGVGRPR